LILVHACSPGAPIAAFRLLSPEKLPPTFNTILPSIQGWDKGTLLTFSTYSLFFSCSTIFQSAEVETPSCLAVSARNRAPLNQQRAHHGLEIVFMRTLQGFAFGFMVLPSGGRVKMDLSGIIGEGPPTGAPASWSSA
jgi:hypothetical protein